MWHRNAQSNNCLFSWNVLLEQNSSEFSESAWLQNGISQQLKTMLEDL